MASITIDKINTKITHDESLTVNVHKGIVTAGFNVIRFIDKDTKQYVFYAPSFEVSGYGATEAKAHEMMDYAINEYFKFLLSMDKVHIDLELTKFGWKHNTILKKVYSKAYVDNNGNLQDFNAEENSIEHLTLTAA